MVFFQSVVFFEKIVYNMQFYWDLSVYLLRAKERVHYKYSNDNKIIYIFDTYIHILNNVLMN